jgi:hypothetical protein
MYMCTVLTVCKKYLLENNLRFYVTKRKKFLRGDKRRVYSIKC